MNNDENADPREQFGFRLGRLARRWRARLDEKMRPHGLTQARWVVMLQLSRGGDGFQQKALAGFVGIEGPTLVHILDKLEKRALIERRQDKADRRGKTVHLTAEGWRMIEVIDAVAAEVRHEHLADISDGDLAHCLSVLERIEQRTMAAAADHDAKDTAERNVAAKLKFGTAESD